jgi:general secretion pathway protein M
MTIGATAAAAGGPEGGVLAQRLAPLRAWWQGLGARDRTMLTIGAAVLGLFFLWTLAVRPAWTTVVQAPRQIDQLDSQLQSMQRMAAEARLLRAAPSITAAQSTAALRAASARLGDNARLAIQGDRAVLTVNGVDSDALRNWLAEVRTGARARPVDAQLTRAAQGFNGSVAVIIAGAP